MEELFRVKDGKRCAANQVLYHLGSRGIEWQLLPDLQKAGIPVMAYCPLGQGRLINDPTLQAIARKHAVAASAVALAWLLTKPGVLSIPKTAHASRVREFAAALELDLDEADRNELERVFPAPKRKSSLAMT
jgi:diketogulonate reductase-like aldo/keto reductase